MQIHKNISLKPYNTFGIDVAAAQFCSVQTEAELIAVLKENTAPLFVLSGGSNMLLTKGIEGLVLHINTKGITVEKSEYTALVTAQAGENWHEFVQYCLAQNLGGLENLALIPGCVGSAPIQNIGAYGVELKDSFVSCKALNRETLAFETFSKDACKFGYRDSIFKKEAKDKYIITQVTFRLSNQFHKTKTEYGAIASELEKRHITKPTITNVADAVIAIRQSKLPDPKVIGNGGSFFKNPIVPKEQYANLARIFPKMPSYPVSEAMVKIPAGWLIDQLGYKGFIYKNAGVHDKQALVLINKTGMATGTEIWELAQKIQLHVYEVYSILIEPEVNVF